MNNDIRNPYPTGPTGRTPRSAKGVMGPMFWPAGAGTLYRHGGKTTGTRRQKRAYAKLAQQAFLADKRAKAAA